MHCVNDIFSKEQVKGGLPLVSHTEKDPRVSVNSLSAFQSPKSAWGSGPRIKGRPHILAFWAGSNERDLSEPLRGCRSLGVATTAARSMHLRFSSDVHFGRRARMHSGTTSVIVFTSLYGGFYVMTASGLSATVLGVHIVGTTAPCKSYSQSSGWLPDGACL